jgi:hypothetical protein
MSDGFQGEIWVNSYHTLTEDTLSTLLEVQSIRDRTKNKQSPEGEIVAKNYCNTP